MKSFVGLLVACAMGFATESLASDTAALFTPIPGNSHSLLVRHRHVFLFANYGCMLERFLLPPSLLPHRPAPSVVPLRLLDPGFSRVPYRCDTLAGTSWQMMVLMPSG
jgi:hypothetical protein